MLSEDSLVREYNRLAGGSEMAHISFARAAVESEYCGMCDVRTLVQKFDEETGIVGAAEEVVIRNQPCRLSFESLKAAENTETAARVSQRAKLFISPDIVIKSGSKITVRQNGVEREYAMSGVPAVYPTHKEVMLRLYADYSGEEEL